LIHLNIGYSSCPNDTYVMAALAQDKVDTPLTFNPLIADVETLNQLALSEKLEVTKLSFAALGKVRNAYGLLYAGAALGRGCGPLVVARQGFTLAGLDRGLVAAPGELTTAHLLLSLYLGKPPIFKQMVFSEIMPAVAREEADFGLVIHEGRFTFAEYGLDALLDLGEWWENKTGRPIPLGGIAIRRDLGSEVARMVDQAIYSSLVMARANPADAMKYVLGHAQEMDTMVVQQHIDLYVNSFTFNIGSEGEEAVGTLFARAEEAGLLPGSPLPLMAHGA
jgi:1,4-dihydroxy-6-naphthoate synthase